MIGAARTGTDGCLPSLSSTGRDSSNRARWGQYKLEKVSSPFVATGGTRCTEPLRDRCHSAEVTRWRSQSRVDRTFDPSPRANVARRTGLRTRRRIGLGIVSERVGRR